MLGGFCARCGEWSDNLRKGYCRKCETDMHREWTGHRIDSALDAYNNWLNMIRAIPTPYKTLTEAQWLEACKHFGGCAYCGTPEIEARSMFIPFKDGGRYCDWNIIPACERCETTYKAKQNPFLRMDNSLNRNPGNQAKKYDLSLEKLQRIVDYLQSKMEVK